MGPTASNLNRMGLPIIPRCTLGGSIESIEHLVSELSLEQVLEEVRLLRIRVEDQAVEIKKVRTKGEGLIGPTL